MTDRYTADEQAKEHVLNMAAVKKLTREINKAVTERNYGRVECLTNQLHQYALVRSWDA